MFHLSPHELSLWQFWKKWTICLDYPWFSSGIELRLVTVAADSILRLTRVLRTECELRLILFCSWLKFRRLDTSCSCLEFRRLDTSYDLFIYLFNNLFKVDKNWLHPTADSSSGSWIQVATWFYPPADSISSGLIRVAADSSSGGWTPLTWVHLNIYKKYASPVFTFLQSTTYWHSKIKKKKKILLGQFFLIRFQSLWGFLRIFSILSIFKEKQCLKGLIIKAKNKAYSIVLVYFKQLPTIIIWVFYFSKKDWSQILPEMTQKYRKPGYLGGQKQLVLLFISF